MTDSVSTQPAPIVRGVADWIHILHNAAATPPGSPDFDRSRRVMRAAKTGMLNATSAGNEADEAAAQPGAAGAALVNFGQGASAGLAQTQALRAAIMASPIGGQALAPFLSTPEDYADYLWKARGAQPGASALGQGAGMLAAGTAAAPLVAPLGLVGGAAALSGAQVGTQAGIESDSPLAGVVAGVPAAVMGGLGAKAISMIPGARQLATSIFARLTGSVPKAAALDAAEAGIRQTLSTKGATAEEVNTIVKEERLNLARQYVRGVGPGGSQATPQGEAALRARLKAQNWGSPEQIEQVVNAWKGGSYDSPSYVRTAARLGTKPPPVPTAAPTGVGNPPPNPAIAQQYVEEANKRIANAAVADATFQQAAAESPATKPPTPALASGHTPDSPPPITQYRAAVRDLETRMGREITKPEQRELMERFFGPSRGVPGHEMWFGNQSFTRKP